MPRKLIEFHNEDLRALEELADDKSASLQELVDEAVRDLLVKHRRFTDLRTALKESGSDGSKRPRKMS
jgi:hypothetical protein